MTLLWENAATSVEDSELTLLSSSGSGKASLYGGPTSASDDNTGVSQGSGSEPAASVGGVSL